MRMSEHRLLTVGPQRQRNSQLACGMSQLVIYNLGHATKAADYRMKPMNEGW